MSFTTIPTQDDYTNEILRLEREHGYCEMQLSFLQVMGIIGGLQLALRHPKFPATSKQMLTNWIHQVSEQIPSPILQRTIAAGFNPVFDVEADQ